MSRGVTLCVPTLDAAETLDTTLNAVARLDPGPAETVVVDGGSTDGTRGIAESYGVPVLDQGPARGLSGARNVALRHCETGYLAMIDSDVVPAPDWLGRIVGCIEEHDAAAATAEVRHDASRTSERWAAHRMDLSPVRTPGTTPIIPGANGCYRTAALRDVGGWNEAYPFANEDVAVSRQLRDAGYDLRYTDRTYVVHIPPAGVDALHQLWRWHRPEGRPGTVATFGGRAAENFAKGGRYAAESLGRGRPGHALIDLAIGPLHTYWDLRTQPADAHFETGTVSSRR